MTLRREVGVRLAFEAADPASVALALAVAEGVPVAAESLRASVGGAPVAVRPQPDAHGTRLSLLEAGPGVLRIEYTAEVVGRAAPAPVDPIDPLVYARPSRYVQSDSLTPLARERFGHLAGWELARAVGDWVHARLAYRPEATSPTAGAVETLEAGAGVCRDFAHVTAALLRALDQPARLVSVYAPQLSPMDLHAVVEVLVEDRWLVVDATRLAPRRGLVRIATGRDAADTAFETNSRADMRLLSMAVEARADSELTDDPAEPVELG